MINGMGNKNIKCKWLVSSAISYVENPNIYPPIKAEKKLRRKYRNNIYIAIAELAGAKRHIIFQANTTPPDSVSGAAMSDKLGIDVTHVKL